MRKAISNDSIVFEGVNAMQYDGYKDQEKRKQYLNEYGKTKRFKMNLSLNPEKDKLIIDWLYSQENKVEYIRTLIKKDMEANR